jgi:hypothetical protein
MSQLSNNAIKWITVYLNYLYFIHISCIVLIYIYMLKFSLSQVDKYGF